MVEQKIWLLPSQKLTFINFNTSLYNISNSNDSIFLTSHLNITFLSFFILPLFVILFHSLLRRDENGHKRKLTMHNPIKPNYNTMFTMINISGIEIIKSI